MARATIPLNFNVFLEKAKLKDDGINYTDWVRNLRIILIPAQKNYVLEAPLGARPAAGATPDIMNVWQSKANDYSIVQCAMLYGLESAFPFLPSSLLFPSSFGEKERGGLGRIPM